MHTPQPDNTAPDDSEPCSSSDDESQRGEPRSEGGSDTDSDVNPGADEDEQDLVDEDCDGFVDETFIDYGDLLVTEIMLDPVAVSDSNGEWFELYNTSSSPIALVNWSDKYPVKDLVVTLNCDVPAWTKAEMASGKPVTSAKAGSTVKFTVAALEDADAIILR